MASIHDSTYVLIFSLISLACFLLLVYLIVRTKEKRRPILRIVLSFIALLSLFAIIVEPQVTTVEDKKTAILLTQSSDQKRLDQLLDSLPRETLIFSLDPQWSKFMLRKITPIATAAHISINYPDIETIYILGEGLDKTNALLLEDKEIIPLLNPLKPGIVNFICPAKLRLGEPLTIQGAYHCNDTAWLYLTGLDGSADSVKVGKDNGLFELTIMPPRVLGKQSFILSSPGLTSDTIYVNVAPFVPLEIVAFISSPGFEFNALKNWLADKHHQLSIRTKVSKDKFNYDYLNRTKDQKAEVKLLEKADLLIADSRSLKELSPLDKRNLQRFITKGLKVLIMSDESLKPGDKVVAGLMDVFLKATKEPERRVNPQWLGKSAIEISLRAEGLVPTGPDYITIMKDQNNDPLVIQQFYGEGMVALAMVKDSYALLLNGLEKEYGEFWSYVIRRMNIENDVPVSSYISPEKPGIVGVPVSVVQHSSGPAPAYVYSHSGADTLYFSQDKVKDGTFHADFWPEHEGWHEVVSSVDSAARSLFYVYGPGQFKTLRQEEKAHTTQHVVKKSSEAASRAGLAAINPLIFFIMFLLSAGGLWLEKKIGD